jgi:hypothetical protein
MGATYWLANHTRREVIWFKHLPAGSKREIAGCAAAAAIVAWYMMENAGNRIEFYNDARGDGPSFEDYREVTDEVVSALIAAEILQDEGRDIWDADDPDCYTRRLRNIWDSMGDESATPAARKA